MSDLLLWFVCLIVGHVRTEWMEAVEVQETMSGVESEPYYTSNVTTEVRFCLRCHSGYQQRWAS